MTILALEFSSEQRSVAIARGNSIFEAIESGGRSTAAFGMIEKVLAEAKIEREEIETIAVGLGPGSYTGIRSAIAMAQGWQLARDNSGSREGSPCQNFKLLGISSVEAIAMQAQAEKVFGRVNVVVDAQRGEIYLAAYEISETIVNEVEPLRITNPKEVGLRCRAASDDQQVVPTVFVGPQVTKWFPSDKIIFPRAATIAKLAASRNDFVPGEKLEPIYLRKTEFVKSPPPRIISGQ